MRPILLLVVVLAACGHGDPNRLVGGACNGDRDCVERCEGGGDFPQGFCTVTCLSDPDCPNDTICANTHGGVCIYPCGDSGDCRFLGPGYVCREKRDFLDRSILVCMGG